MITSYPITGDNKVETVRYTLPEQSARTGQVFINQTQYFEGISIDVWNFRLGGDPICQNWLQSHQGCSLSNKYIQQYQRIVVVLEENH